MHTNRRAYLAALAVLFASLAGCYNAEVLLQERSEATAALHMEEVDLGEFTVTLPHVLGDATDNIVEFHVFGQVERRDHAKVSQALLTRGPELRSRMLVSVRSLDAAAFDEPKLTTFRHSIADVINNALEEKLVRRIGFYNYAFTSM